MFVFSVGVWEHWNNTLQYTATRNTTLQYTATQIDLISIVETHNLTATRHCNNTLWQHTATPHCNTLATQIDMTSIIEMRNLTATRHCNNTLRQLTATHLQHRSTWHQSSRCVICTKTSSWRSTTWNWFATSLNHMSFATWLNHTYDRYHQDT